MILKLVIIFLGACIVLNNPLRGEQILITSDDIQTISASNEDYGNKAANAMDDDPGTRWESTHGIDQVWLEISLKKEQTVSSIMITWERASARVYDIQISDDDKTWKTAAAITDGSEGEQRLIKFEPVNAKRIRISCKKRATQWGYSIFEILLNPQTETDWETIKNYAYMDPQLSIDERVEDLLSRMTLNEKIYQLAGKNVMDGKTNIRLGIPPLLMSDGPHGIRMFGTATCYPSLIAAASWDVEIMKKIGKAIGEEARAKGRNLVLGPCINIHRTPLGGRNFESYSEDPYLTSRMAVAWITGVQQQKIGTSVKHFAANNQEENRTTISVEISERALREIYLPGFKAAIQEGDAVSVMGAYNKINGDWCCENKHLLTDILKNEWGFKGFVVSDWGAIHGTLKDINAGSDLEMGGPGTYFTRTKILTLIKNGTIPESIIDDKVRRILYTKFYLGLFDGVEKKYHGSANTKKHQKLVKTAAENGMVLLKNENKILPLNIDKIKSIALIGPTVKRAIIDGGGSSEVIPPYSVSPFEGLNKKCDGKIEIKYAKGCDMPLDWIETTVSGAAPQSAEKIVVKCISENMKTGNGFSYIWFDNATLKSDSDKGKEFIKNGTFAAGGKYWHKSGNAKYIECHDWHSYDGVMSYGVGNDNGPNNASGVIFQKINTDGKIKKGDNFTFKVLVKGEGNYTGRASVKLEYLDSNNKLLAEYKSEVFTGTGSDGVMEIPSTISRKENLLNEAVKTAEKSDIAVIFAGFYKYLEGEGVDRKDLFLPEGQDELIEAVSKANKNTIVVLTNGTPIDMRKWVDKVPVIIEAFYMGQEGGNAVSNVIFGDVNPSGKLPFTFPEKIEDNPSYGNYPGSNGKVNYAEDIFVGYRYYDSKQVEPLFPFGYGLSYTEFKYSNLKIKNNKMNSEKTIRINMDIENIGKVTGKEVVQLYIRDVESSLIRPYKELKRFDKINLKPGEKKNIEFELKEDDLSFYDPLRKKWIAEPGDFEVLIGSSSKDIRLKGKFTI